MSTSQNQAENVGGHLDTRSTLQPLLENHKPAVAENVTVGTYHGWSAERRARFTLQRTDRITAGIVVKTPSLDELDKEVRRAEIFARRDVGRVGVVVNGRPGTGKTTAALHAMAGAFRRHALRYPNWKRDEHIPVVYVEVPPGSTARGVMGRFLRFLEVPFIEKMTLEERTQLVTTQLQRAHTSLVVVDEMQNLARVSNGTFESAQAIKNLTNSLKAVPLYVGFNLDRIFSHDDIGAQFASRSTMVSLERMHFRTHAGRRDWKALVRAFETQFGLFSHPTGTLDPHAEYLWRRTSGSIGALSRLLTVAALELVEAAPADQIITVSHLETIKLDLATERLYDMMVNAPKKAPRAA